MIYKRPARRSTRAGLTAAAVVLLATNGLLGCEDNTPATTTVVGLPRPRATATKAPASPDGCKAASGDGSGIAGCIDGSTSPTPSPRASDSPSPAGSAAPTPSPTAPALPAGPTVVSVTVSPAALALNAPGFGGDSAGLVTTGQLSATVILSDASTSSAVTWSSSAPTVASVSTSGTVDVLPGAQPQTVTITAAAQADPGRVAIAQVTVGTGGILEVGIQ